MSKELSPRLEEVLMYINDSNKEIASRLGITEKTVKFHKTRLFKALGVKCAREIRRKNAQTSQEA